jgi:hypothetical protein
MPRLPQRARRRVERHELAPQGALEEVVVAAGVEEAAGERERLEVAVRVPLPEVRAGDEVPRRDLVHVAPAGGEDRALVRREREDAIARVRVPAQVDARVHGADRCGVGPAEP